MISENKKSRVFGFRAAKVFFCVSLFFFALQGSSFAREIGPEGVFLVDKNYDYSGRSQVTASLVYESDDAYFYVDADYLKSLSAASKAEVMNQLSILAEEFDDTIYPTTKGIFGEEWKPGIDDNPKLVILFTKLQYSIGGYFSPNDEYPKADVTDARSNENEMIYMNPDFLKSGKAEGFLSHEFQHMIYWNEKTRKDGLIDDVWINEGRSEMASSIIEDKLGKAFKDETLSVRKKDFLLNYTDSIMDWNNMNADYSSVNIFMQYIKDHFGTGIFKNLNVTNKTGANNLDHVLRTEDNISLGGAFTNWTLANYINDTSFDIRYGYENKNLKTDFNVTPSLIYDKDGDGKINLTNKLYNWSGDYYKVDLKGRSSGLYLEISFSGDAGGNFVLPYIINYSNGSKEVGFVDINSKQAGSKDIVFKNGEADSIVFALSSQKMEALGNDSDVKSYGFALEVKFDQVENKTLPDGTLIKLNDQDKIYVIEGGKKRWIADEATFVSNGYEWKNVVVVNATEISLYPDGRDVKIEAGAMLSSGSLVKGEGSKVYLIENNQKRWIKDAQTFVFSGYDWNKIIKLSEADLARYPDGSVLAKNLFADGTLVKAADDFKVYMIENGKKRWVASLAAFDKNHYGWASVVATSGEAVASYPSGINIE